MVYGWTNFEDMDGHAVKCSDKTHDKATIRLGQIKDHTVQAAIRLQQLVTTQAVTLVLFLSNFTKISRRRCRTMHQYALPMCKSVFDQRSHKP